MPQAPRLFGLLLLAAVALAPAAARAQEDRTPSGTIEIDQTQFALLFSGAFGGGTLHYQGRSYGFTIGGLGIGGIGIATLHATGEVYACTTLATSAASTARRARATRWARRAPAACGSRTPRASTCTSRPSARASSSRPAPTG